MSAREFLCNSILGAALSFAAMPLARAAEPPPTPASNPSEADLDRARELFDNGKTLYLDGSYEPAVAAFKQAYALSGDPLLLYNIAQAYDRAEQFDGAIEYFEYYRAFAPAAERDALTDKVESLQRRKIKAQAEAETDEGTTETPPSSSGGEDNKPTPARPTGPEPVDNRPKVFTPLAIALSAVAVVGLGTGVGLGVASRRRNSDAESMCSTDPILCPSEAESDLDTSRNLALGADIAFGVGAAVAVGAIVVIALNASKRNKATASRPSSRIAVGAQRRGASLTLRF